MTVKGLVVCLLAALVVVGAMRDADAHGLIGKCFLPATLAIDDPFVADELSLPLDDIAPQIFTWTPFHGILGPTFPR